MKNRYANQWQMLKMCEKEEEKGYLATAKGRNVVELEVEKIEVIFHKMAEFLIGKWWRENDWNNPMEPKMIILS